MNEITTFINEEFGQVRTLMIGEEPWFAAKDVAVALGYSNPQKAIRDHIDAEDKTVNDSFTVHGTQGILINESGLYSLIFGSKLESAQRFKRWVTSEVLPTIRKNGMYATEQLLDNPEFAIATFIRLKEEREKRKLAEEKVEQKQKEIEQKDEQIKAMKPKEKYYDSVNNLDGCVDFGTFDAAAQNDDCIHLGRNKLLEWCRDMGYLCNSEGLKNKPSQIMMANGYMKYKQYYAKEHGYFVPKYTPMLTGKGQIWLTKKLLEHFK